MVEHARADSTVTTDSMQAATSRGESPEPEKCLSHSDDGSPDAADFPTKVDWVDDPENPQNWKYAKRCFHTLIPSKFVRLDNRYAILTTRSLDCFRNVSMPSTSSWIADAYTMKNPSLLHLHPWPLRGPGRVWRLFDRCHSSLLFLHSRPRLWAPHRIALQ